MERTSKRSKVRESLLKGIPASYSAAQKQASNVRASLNKPEESVDTRPAAREVVRLAVNEQRYKELDMKESAEFGESSHSLRGKKSVCSSRKLKNSEATAKVHAERTPYPELSVQSSQSKLQEKSNVKKAKVAGPEVDTRKQRKPDVKDNVGHDNPGGFFKPQPSGHRGHRKWIQENRENRM